MSVRIPCVLALAFLLLSAPAAMAHRALFFAYMDGGDIVCEGGFPGGKTCKGCPVKVLDAATGEELARVNTDESGIVRIPLPERAAKARYGLKLVLSGGEGHQAEWLLEAEEYLDASKLPETAPQPDLTVPRSERQAQPSAAKIDAGALKRIVAEAVDEALAKQLTPIRRELAASRDSGPSVGDVLGGLGWLVGLAGLMAWRRSRSYS